MSKIGMSEKVKHFIFEYIDSVEQLEVLLFLRQNADQPWSIEKIAQDLRSSSSSVETRLQSLEKSRFIQRESHGSTLCRYVRGNEDFEKSLDELTELYKTRRQSVLELIFSPLKKSRHFANAFKVKQGDGGSEDV